METAGSRGGVLALRLLLLAACAVLAHAQGSEPAPVPVASLVLDLEPGQKPACVLCNDAQLGRCWTNLQESPAYPADDQLTESDVCDLSPAMEAFWACLKACAGNGACSSAELSQMGMRECAGNPIPCNLGGCPDCPDGLPASDVMTMMCKEMSEDFWEGQFGCGLECGESKCSDCPPDLPAGDYEHDLEECHLQKTWEDLTGAFVNETAYAGGLGSMMNDDFEVWLCLKNHPCLDALRAKGKKVPLHVRMPAATATSQGYRSSTNTPCVFPFKYDDEYHYQCVDDSWGLWCGTTSDYDGDGERTSCTIPGTGYSNSFPACSATTHPTKRCVFPFIFNGKSYHTCTDKQNNGQLWCATTSNYDLDRQWTSCTCGAANLEGAVHQVYDGFPASMQISAADLAGLGANWSSYTAVGVCAGAAEIEFSAMDMLTSDEVDGVEYYIYSNAALDGDSVWSTYIGCFASNTCGVQVQGPITVRKISLPADSYYLIVSKKSGYYYTYTIIFLTAGGYSMHSQLVKEMEVGQDRVVLHWGHSQDLDLWVYDARDLNKKVGWSRRTAKFAGGDITLDVDNGDGLEGPETTQFQSLTSGTVMVWIHHWSDEYTYDEALDYPASVDIFCYLCKDDNGILKAGYVTTLTQKATDVPASGVSWWKVGEFVVTAVGASRSVQWKTCQLGCYKEGPAGPAPPVTLTFDVEDAVIGGEVSGETTINTYASYPDDFESCIAPADGREPECGTLVGSGSSIEVTSDVHYLIVASNSLFYTATYELYAGSGGASVTIGMVPKMAVGQNRVVLRWGHVGDLDLWVWEADNKDNSVGWYRPTRSIAGGSVTLDRDNWDGRLGPETTQFNNLRENVEVWIDYYGTYTTYTGDILRESPASVDIYCHTCTYNNKQKAGYVTTVTQDAMDVEGGLYSWWKVGTYIVEEVIDPKDNSATYSVTWQTCVEDCYKDDRPQSRRRRIGYDDMPAKPKQLSSSKPQQLSRSKWEQTSAVPRKSRRPHAQRHAHLRRTKKPRGAGVGASLLLATHGEISQRRAGAAPSCGNLLQTFTGDSSVVYGNAVGIQYLVVSEAPCVDMEGYKDSEGDDCYVWAQNPDWCSGSPDDGVLDYPSAYTNAEGIDPSMACCVCRARGYDPVFTIVKATTYGAFLDSVFNPVSVSSRPTLPFSFPTLGQGEVRMVMTWDYDCTGDSVENSDPTVTCSYPEQPRYGEWRGGAGEVDTLIMPTVSGWSGAGYAYWASSTIESGGSVIEFAADQATGGYPETTLFKDLHLATTSAANYQCWTHAYSGLGGCRDPACVHSFARDQVKVYILCGPNTCVGEDGAALEPGVIDTLTVPPGNSNQAELDTGIYWWMPGTVSALASGKVKWIPCTSECLRYVDTDTPKLYGSGGGITTFADHRGSQSVRPEAQIRGAGKKGKRKAFPPATHTKAVSRAVRSKAQHASLETDSKSLRVSFENAANNAFDLMCWVFNEHTRRFVAWGTNDEVDLVKLSDITVWLHASARDMLVPTSDSSGGISASAVGRMMYFVYSDYPDDFMGCVGHGMPVLVQTSTPTLVAKYNMSTSGWSEEVSDVEYRVYSPHPNNYLGCMGWTYDSGCTDDAAWIETKTETTPNNQGGQTTTTWNTRCVWVASNVDNLGQLCHTPIYGYASVATVREKCPSACGLCGGAACGTLVTTFKGPEGYVPADNNYLIVSRKSGYYTGYLATYIGISGFELTTHMINELQADRYRVVLRWMHSQDLDLWVYSADHNSKVGWSQKVWNGAQDFITHDVDMEYGPGIETTGLKLGLPWNSGVTTPSSVVREIWVHNYDDAFTSDLVASFPAMLDVYCSSCKYKGLAKSGYVRTVKQTATGLSNPFVWWKAGQFTIDYAVDNTDNITWTDCVSDCFAVYPGAGPAVPVSFSARDMITGSAIACADDAGLCLPTFEVFVDYVEPFVGCYTSAGCGRHIGSAVAGGTLNLPKETHILVVGVGAGYYTSYTTMKVTGPGQTVAAEFVKKMEPGQSRVVLKWAHTQDLDLWVYDAGNLNKNVGWSGRSATIAGGTVKLDVDNWSGLTGPETTQFQSLASGTTMVWIHHYDATFKNPQVANTPASVDVFCYACTYKGVPKAGYVTTVTQLGSTAPVATSAGLKWWKVGQFVAVSGLVTWEDCSGAACYKAAPAGPAPMVQITFSSKNVVTGSTISDAVTYKVYANYIQNFMGCCTDANSCTLCGELAGTGSPVTVRGDQFYLVVATSAGYDIGYFEVTAGLTAFSRTLNMVQQMAVGQNRVVLRWGHTADLDLWAVNKANKCQKSFWANLGAAQNWGFGPITLDRDVTSGPGIETTQFQSLTNGNVEVWIDYYGGKHTQQRAGEFPASVDVYCHSCTYKGIPYAGYVTTVVQNASDLAGGGKRYWKVGEFGASFSAVTWTTCNGAAACYQDSDPSVCSRGEGEESSAPKPKPTLARRSAAESVPHKTRRPVAVQKEVALRALAIHGKVRRPLEARMAHLRVAAQVSTCGNLVSKATQTPIKVKANNHYLVVSTLQGYYRGYDETWVSLSGGLASVGMVPTLGASESRVVLRWGHGQDLDLWAYANTSSGSNQVVVGWTNKIGTIGSGSTSIHIELDVDNTNGKVGPETTKLRLQSDSRTDIWIQHYSDVFTPVEVDNFPASVDLYCAKCLNDQGHDVSGYVKTVTQHSSAMLEVKWWRAGAWFSSSDSMGRRVTQWRTCLANCWAVYPGAGAPITVTLSMKNVLTGATVAGGIRYRVYRQYVASWLGCCVSVDDCSGCGTQVLNFEGGSALLPGGGDFLVVATTSGYYARYFLLTTLKTGPQAVSNQMVQTMAVGQNRVVLSWAHSGDLDLESYYNHPTRGLQRVYYANTVAEFEAGTSVALDVDNGNGLLGPETISFQDLSNMAEGKIVMVWVKHFSGTYTRALVSATPARVDVYCHSCKLQYVDGTKAGYVTTVEQVSGDVPTAGAKWWKVGQYQIVAAGSGRVAEWQSCKGPTCFRSDVVVPPAPIAVSFSSTDARNGNAMSGVTYKVFAEYPVIFEKCCNGTTACLACGAFVGQGPSVSVTPDDNYLVVATLTGYYTTYMEISVATSATSRTVSMVEQMAVGQNRVVLRWGHTADLDLWAVNAANRGQKSYYANLGAAQNWGFGPITLDRDVTSGPGIETTRLQSLTNGNVEVWIDYFGQKWTSSMTSSFPASVDVYCYACLYNGRTYAGYVTTVVQNYLDVSGTNSAKYRYWLVGLFKSTGAQVEWITCTKGTACYVVDDPSTLTGASIALATRRRQSDEIAAEPAALPPKQYVASRRLEEAVPLKVRTKVFEDVHGVLEHPTSMPISSSSGDEDDDFFVRSSSSSSSP